MNDAHFGAPDPRAGTGGPAVVLVEDDASVREALRTVLELDGYGVRALESAEALLADVAIADTTCLILDVNLPGISGLRALEHLRRTEIWTPAIVVSARATDAMRQEALRLNAIDLLTKPIDIDLLLGLLGGIAR